MKHGADLHNFGRAVTRQMVNGTVFYFKPRPVYWEWLLFGMDSPLRDCFENQQIPEPFSTKQCRSMADAIFGLRVERGSDEKSGRVLEVIKNNGLSAENNETSAFLFGILLSYCFTFGVLDIHNENIIFTGNRFQVIDAEIVFSKLILPDETLLLPFKETIHDESGLSLVMPDGKMNTTLALRIIEGFSAGLRSIHAVADQLNPIISHHIISNPNIPVRVILRRTRSYYHHLEGQVRLSLMPAEQLQLQRGDIPYFFKFIGRDDLYWYSRSIDHFEAVAVPREFKDAVSRVGRNPSDLLTPERIRRDLFAPGILLLARKLLPATWHGSAESDSLSLKANEDQLHLSSPWGNFKTLRRRTAPPLHSVSLD